MFEPQKNVYNYIKKKYKNDKRVKIFNCAVSDTIKDQKLKINLHDLTTSLTESNKSNSYLEYKAKLFDSTLENMVSEIYLVKSLKLSSILKQKSINTIDFLKIDTEGHELNVLEAYSWDVLPTMMKIEHRHLSEDSKDKLKGLFKGKGYIVHNERFDFYCFR